MIRIATQKGDGGQKRYGTLVSFGNGPGNYNLTLYLDGHALHTGTNLVDVYSVVLPNRFLPRRVTWNQVFPSAKRIGRLKVNYAGYSQLQGVGKRGSDFLFLIAKGKTGSLTVLRNDVSKFELVA